MDPVPMIKTEESVDDAETKYPNVAQIPNYIGSIDMSKENDRDQKYEDYLEDLYDQSKVPYFIEFRFTH
jgi:hypothetical protein